MHWEYDERGCNCGDSYCGDCRTAITRTYCGAGMNPQYRTRVAAKVTCPDCFRKKRVREAQPK